MLDRERQKESTHGRKLKKQHLTLQIPVIVAADLHPNCLTV